MDLGIGGLGSATEIGAGASAIVYRARQTELDREVAVKVLSVTDETYLRRFRREAKTLGKLSLNPGIVTVYDTGVTAAGHPYLILELCETSVLERLESDGPFEPLEACRVVAQVAEAVALAHDDGVIHRDLKPANVLRSQTGRYMVNDFGISTVISSTAGQTDSVGSTAGCVAPETLTGEQTGTAADVYALGATLFHMVAGRAPFTEQEQGPNLLALAQRVINDPVPDLRGEGLPDDVCRIIEAAMSKQPEDRPTAAELRDRLWELAGSRADDDRSPAEDRHAAAVAAAASTDTIFVGGRRPLPPGSTDGDRDHGRDGEGSAKENRAAQATIVDGSGPALTGLAAAPPSPTVEDGPNGPDRGHGAPMAGPGATTHLIDGLLDGPVEGAGLPPPPESSQPHSRAQGANLNDRPLAPEVGVPLDDRRFAHTIDDRRRIGPLVIGAVVGLAMLVGIGGYMANGSGGGDGDGDDPVSVEAVDGPTSSIDATGNEAINRGGTGNRGVLDPSTLGGDDEQADPVLLDVPLVTGLSTALAERRLRSAGFIVNRVEQESSRVAVGDVIRQTPSAGTTAVSGAIVTIYVSTQRAGETVRIPAVVGRTETEARASLTALGIRATASRAFSETVDVGDVISTMPTVGTTVNVGSTVKLVISDGPPATRCADVIGLAESVASARLTAAGLTVSVTRESSDTVADGEVISCTEEATTASLVVSSGVDRCGRVIGAELATARATLEAAGLTVTEMGSPSNAAPPGHVFGCTIAGSGATLAYATGPLPTACPDVAGRTVAQARSALEAAGFTDIEVRTMASGTVPDGAVISCSVAGATATLTVSSGPATVTVPDISGLPVQAAVDALTAAGLMAGGPEQVDSSRPAGEIVGSAPAAGAMVPQDTVVTILVSGGSGQATVPDVVGSTQAAAVAAIEGVGLVAAVQTQPVPLGSAAVGKVISMSPPAGTSLAAGTTVTITVGAVEESP